ncbi:MAG: Fe-S cluster assembly ATPase SufC [Pseudomonadota bacterium]
MLEIEDLHVSVEKKPILQGLSLVVKAGEVHAIMGPNGSGKSTLAYTLAGREGYEITKGEVRFDGQNLTDLEPHERARAGLFLGFQYPIEIPGLTFSNFLRHSVNAIRKSRGREEFEPLTFIRHLRAKAREFDIGDDVLKRAVNVGFSGGERKRVEALQLALLEPRLALMDETDSGLDIDALRDIASAINQLRSPDRALVLITHYQRLLDYITPDYVHALGKGRILASGTMELAQSLEKEGYARLLEDRN